MNAPIEVRVRPRRRILDRHPAARFVVRRVSAGALTLLVASALIYFAVQVLPGNVVEVVLGRTATPQRVLLLTRSLHLDHPVVQRYWDWLTGIVTGHLGVSSAALAQGTRLPVWQSIHLPLLNSLILAGCTMVIFVPLCLVLGTVSALRAGRRTDHVISLSALSLSALPEFLVGTLLIVVFFNYLNLFPPIAAIAPGSIALTNVKGMALPILTLVCVSTAFGTRLLRASLVEVLREDYVTMARLNGYRERRVIWRYCLRNALAPTVQVMAQMSQYLIGGIIVTESVFNFPGIGSALVQAVAVRDPQVVSVIAILLASGYVFINIVADLAVVFLVPRLRTAL